jgi:hypothetical protein
LTSTSLGVKKLIKSIDTRSLHLATHSDPYRVARRRASSASITRSSPLTNSPARASFMGLRPGAAASPA